ALRILGGDRGNNIVLVILDLEMPVMGGLEALEMIRAAHPALPVIVLTGSTNTRDAVQAMKIGAVDFLSKPIEEARLDVSARNALTMALMGKEISLLRRQTGESCSFEDL